MTIFAGLIICLAPVVYDGDTTNRCGNERVSIRLFGIEADEASEPGHLAAKANLEKLVQGGVTCKVKGTSFSRIVAQCFNAYGIDVGKAQLDAGHAKEWCAYSRNYYGSC